QQGFRIDVKEKDYPYLLRMIRNDDPPTRLAGLLLASYNLNDKLYTAVLEAALDEYPQVSDTAREILLQDQKSFLPWVGPRLQDLDFELLTVALDIMVKAKYTEGAELVVPLLYRESRTLTQLAAKTLSGLLDYDDPLLEQLKLEDQRQSRQAYYRCLSYYHDPDLIPLILMGLEDSDPQIWGTVVSSLYDFKEELIPYLYEMLDRNEYRYTLTVLQLLEQMNDVIAIPLLLELTASEYRNIAQRSAIHLQSLGVAVIPYMASSLSEALEPQLQAYLWILDRIDDKKTLDLYRDIWMLDISSLNALAEKGLMRFDNEGLDLIHSLFLQGNAPLDLRILTLLRRLKDPWLVMNSRGAIRIETAFYLIRNSRTNDLVEYLDEAVLPESYKNEIKLLREANQLAASLEQWEITHGSNDSGLYFQRELQWVGLKQEVLQKEQAARQANQQYFQSKDREQLTLARQFREEASSLQAEADALEEVILILRESKPEEYQQYLQYQNILERLSRIWSSLSPTLRPLGQRVYSAWGLDGAELLRKQRQL
nr:hypothetical protein [Spirochaetaceae bacterium]